MAENMSSRGRPKRPVLERSKTSFSSMKAILSGRHGSTTSLSGMANNSPARTAPTTPRKLFLRSGTASSAATPTTGVSLPVGLNAVTRRLEELSILPDGESKASEIRKLEHLAAECDADRKECKKILKEAMDLRVEGKFDTCRADCMRIVHHKHAKVGTRSMPVSYPSTRVHSTLTAFTDALRHDSGGAQGLGRAEGVGAPVSQGREGGCQRREANNAAYGEPLWHRQYEQGARSEKGEGGGHEQRVGEADARAVC
ncbi:hypothetical protein BAUCODRAFT_529345 [Baudoinia panamericana UAMH 10762]|uniref:Uncharacterized protein n=1 Tax=Baudoinia panamericana (strain UAMH 10762) TaxID=717646 RepID=M2N7V7_BAUPA|nr:uncharacterized protein BAUCODRAFT_529345 [Baudoinia panamericana UAMH 10762]EMC95164.1 hypothetical protein BAUCODRAFT_529345 [Baudoinia panamericana UAMH 10762]